MPPEVLCWPPAERIRQIPKNSRAVGLFDMARAVQSLAIGDAEAWSDILARLSDAGLLLPNDPPLGHV